MKIGKVSYVFISWAILMIALLARQFLEPSSEYYVIQCVVSYGLATYFFMKGVGLGRVAKIDDVLKRWGGYALVAALTAAIIGITRFIGQIQVNVARMDCGEVCGGDSAPTIMPDVYAQATMAIFAVSLGVIFFSVLVLKLRNRQP